jgi:hypothetical protein
MQTLSKQILVRVSQELDDLITQAFSQHLKETGEYCSRSDYIRRMLQAQCELELVKRNGDDNGNGEEKT